jgi:kinesin family protein 1
MVGNQTIITNPSTEIIDEAKKNFSFDYSFWSHDGYKVRDDGVNIPQDNQSSYAD